MNGQVDPAVAELVRCLLDTTRHPDAWSTSVLSLARLLGAPDGLLLLEDPTISSDTIELTSRACDTCPTSMTDYALLLRNHEPKSLRGICPQHCVLMAGLTRQDGNRRVLLAVRRPAGQHPFARADLERFAVLFPVVAHAAQLTLANLRTEVSGRALAELYQRGTTAFVLVRSGGEVVTSNRSADSILSEGDGLRVRRGMLEASTQKDTQALLGAIQRSVSNSTVRDPYPGRRLAISRPSLKRPLGVAVFPLDRSHPRQGGGGAVAAVAMFDPEHPTTCSSRALQELYRLTDAEARLARTMLEGATIKEASQMLGISLLTARSHLKRIFAKTGTRRQVELLQLLMRAPVDTLLPPVG